MRIDPIIVTRIIYIVLLLGFLLSGSTSHPMLAGLLGLLTTPFGVLVLLITLI